MTQQLQDALGRLGVDDPSAAVVIGGQWRAGAGEALTMRSPINGEPIGSMALAEAASVSQAVAAVREAFPAWRDTPAPARGDLVRLLGEQLRVHKADLASIVSWEAGKITQEALGEVQEMIDICEFAVGLSRQLYGLTIASERPGHRLTEQWHPLGPIGVITAFNFPVAVWAWNAALALVCGDPIIWKPSEKAPLCALACHAVLQQAIEQAGAPAALNSVLVGGVDVGEALADSSDLPLISATGSTRMGRAVAQRVAARLGRSLLELGGNNAMIVAPSADVELTIRSAVFSAAGTCGQRCTTLRRLIVHESLHDEIVDRLVQVYGALPVGNPLDDGVLVGPLIDERAFNQMNAALAKATDEGGAVHHGERVEVAGCEGGYYVRPAVVAIDAGAAIVQQETFAPILYVMKYATIEEAIRINNDVPQGLSSSIMTNDVREAELFCAAAGSDCGIANVNIGTSGAEIGGAFGGEKDTGGGRESGSDAWKNYMRRATNTINYSTSLPLAQGIEFDIPE